MTPVLYIIMRSDLHTMAGGKGMAQAAHAANMFTKDMEKYDEEHDMSRLFREWSSETNQGFGTTITLAAPEEGFSFSHLFESLREYNENHLQYGIVHDPTYPIRDGAFTHLIPVDTCGYVFLDKDNTNLHILDLMLNYSLYPTFEVKNEKI